MRRLLLSLMLLACFAMPALAEDFTRDQIEAIVREVIQKNPKLIIDSVENYGRQQQEEDMKQASEQVKKNMGWLHDTNKHASAGNPKGDVTIVEFFDYNCGYCKQALTDIMTLLEEDKNLRLIFVEIPILGDSSMEAARWALASREQKMYLEYHIALMRHKGPLDDVVMMDYAKKLGLNVEKLKKDKLMPAHNVTIGENLNMARTLGIQGTPAFVIGDQLVRGYIGVDAMRDAVKKAREAK